MTTQAISPFDQETYCGSVRVLIAADTLDDPVRAALAGRHQRFVRKVGRAWRYDPEVAPFGTLPADPEPADWRDAAQLIGPGQTFSLVRPDSGVPDGWELVRRMDALQMVASRPLGRTDPETVRLTAADVPEMLELIARTRPGPFGPRTIELGTYLGIRDAGALVAMAGERLSSPGFTEISAICTDPDHRGRGLAVRLIGAVAAVIEGRGDRVYLHVVEQNTGAIRVYERAGFVTRRRASIDILRPRA
jgi:ribosomal protein S18 acetylase RimI-like enzyme